MLGGFQEDFRPWTAVTAVEEWKGQIAVFFGRRNIWGIPTADMTADQRAVVLTILRSRGTVIPAGDEA